MFGWDILELKKMQDKQDIERETKVLVAVSPNLRKKKMLLNLLNIQVLFTFAYKINKIHKNIISRKNTKIFSYFNMQAKINLLTIKKKVSSFPSETCASQSKMTDSV